MGVKIPEAFLNSGEKIPLIGMGTASAPLPHDQLTSAFITAIETGYRLFDTAALYGSEAPLGKAISKALQRGLVQTRDELFITSKLWCTDAHHDLVLPALKKTLENLGLEYIDLYLIHCPVSLKPSGEYTFYFDKDDLVPMDIKAVWESMEECQRQGFVKSIGLSNFSCKKISQLMATAKIPPAVNQVEMTPLWQQGKLRDFCRERGIHVSAWSPLGAFGAPWGRNTVMENPVLKEIAAAKGKTVPQVSLRWIYEQGASVMVKSFNKERMTENLQIFDWQLSEEDLHKISQIPQRKGFPGVEFISPDGPFKTLEELWDEEEV